MNRLLKIGFIPVGNWTQNDSLGISFTLNSNHNTKNILYAFISNGAIMYIGKTIRSLNNRMYGYQNPGPTQSTNIRIKALIKKCFLSKMPVDIFILPDNGLLRYGDFKINIPGGLEDSLIYELNPEWNFVGKKILKEDKASEDIKKAKPHIPEIKTAINSAGSFVIILGRTYFNQGFFNVPVKYSKKFAGNNSRIEILLGNTTNSIEGYINRHANKNGTPRIMGGSELKRWIQKKFKLGDKMKIHIFSPSSIGLRND